MNSSTLASSNYRILRAGLDATRKSTSCQASRSSLDGGCDVIQLSCDRVKRRVLALRCNGRRDHDFAETRVATGHRGRQPADALSGCALVRSVSPSVRFMASTLPLVIEPPSCRTSCLPSHRLWCIALLRCPYPLLALAHLRRERPGCHRIRHVAQCMP